MSTTFCRIGKAGGTPTRDRAGCSRSWHNCLNLIRLPVRTLQNDCSMKKRPCLASFWPRGNAPIATLETTKTAVTLKGQWLQYSAMVIGYPVLWVG